MATGQRFEVTLSLRDAETVRRGLASIGADGERALKRIDAATTPASSGLRLLDEASRGVQGQMAGMASQAGVAGDALTALGKGGLAAAAGLGVAVAAFTAIVGRAQDVTKHFAEISDASERVGASAERMQVLRQVFIANASTAEELQAALETLQTKYSEAEAGNEKLAATLLKYGLDVTEASADTVDFTVVLEKLAAGAITAADAKELLGRAAKGLQPALAAVGDVQEKVNAGLRNGTVISGELTQKFGELNDKLELLNETSLAKHADKLLVVQNAWVNVKGVIIDVTAEIVNAIAKMTEAFTLMQRLNIAAARTATGINQPRAGATGSWSTPEDERNALMFQGSMGGLRMNPQAPQTPPPPRTVSGGRMGRRGGGGRVSSRAEDELTGTVPMDRLGAFSEELFQFEGDWKDVMASAEKEQKRQQDLWDEGFADRLEGLRQQKEAFEDAQNPLIKFGENLTSIEGMTQGVIQGIAGIGQTAIASFADAVVEGQNFSEMLDSLAKTIEKTLIQMTLQIALQQAIGAGAVGIGGLFGGAAPAPGGAAGGAPYARGGAVQASLPYGVYDRPTVFQMETPGFHPMARGMGLLGEAGPEAVLPLRRSPSGRLGVEGAGPTVNIQVNNSSSAKVSTEQRQGPGNGELEIIFDIVEQRMASQLARPGTTLNRSMAAASNPLRAR